MKDLSLDRSGRDTATDNEVEESRKMFSDLWTEVNAKDEQIQQRILEKLSLEDSESRRRMDVDGRHEIIRVLAAPEAIAR